MDKRIRIRMPLPFINPTFGEICRITATKVQRREKLYQLNRNKEIKRVREKRKIKNLKNFKKNNDNNKKQDIILWTVRLFTSYLCNIDNCILSPDISF